jgi:hypothetical protein
MPIARFRQTPSRCIDCHRVEYETVASPDHVAGGFSTECQECHNTMAWTPATMTDHDAFFPIFSGTHNNVWNECSTCHTDLSNNRIFNCLGCHEHRQTAMDSRHVGMAGYSYVSNACLSCHPTGDAGEFRDHDAQFFPIYSGRHNNVWNDCSACHGNAANPRVFGCLGCHEHAQATMDPVHQGMSGYSYNSQFCLSCHPSGESGQFLEHDAQFFPIYSGTHSGAWDACATCHPTAINKKVFTCIECHEHNQEKTDDEHLGKVSGYTYTPISCYDCHADGRK